MAVMEELSLLPDCLWPNTSSVIGCVMLDSSLTFSKSQLGLLTHRTAPAPTSVWRTE